MAQGLFLRSVFIFKFSNLNYFSYLDMLGGRLEHTSVLQVHEFYRISTTFWFVTIPSWIPNLGALPIIASVSLTHLPCLFACFYEFVSCVYSVFSTYLSTCVARAACFVFCSISLTAFLFSFSFFYKFDKTPMSRCLLMHV